MGLELLYRLDDLGYTIYHRAALGGLAATIRAWGNAAPMDIKTEVERLQVRLYWDNLTDHSALKQILEASFRLTSEKIIDLPGQFIPSDEIELKIAIHNGLCATFLQHPKMRPGEKTPRSFDVKVAESASPQKLTYKAIDSYAHQKAQGTGLLEKLKNSSQEPTEQFPETAFISQFMIPGALKGSRLLEDEPSKVILLHFLMVACPIFFLRSQIEREQTYVCVLKGRRNKLQYRFNKLHGS
ncbi:type I-MYXAN CRISPR-associated Cas8a1/Cmx1 [Fortiea contorta]|uniref:type I-MYXAN CRISPR-associated Cas8a1/Cmx1 n=1 Tax=Fortiea contorta TaxID=1892405 RepID=UPI00034C506A|nr:type I-MYXAN CRISPR-associated Cas8a1/Cmx1 [Fortiea contorta]